MALTHYLSLNELEEIMVYEHVADKMDYFIELTNKNKNITQLQTKKFTAFKKPKDNIIEIYPFINTLKPGIHEVDFKKHTYTIAIQEINNSRYYVLYDETDFENRELFLLITLSLSIALAILFSLWFGYWISGKIISPISRLANQVSQLQARQLAGKISTEYANDEVGQLAETFDNFVNKLILFVERERSFTADASHELRTPLAIIQGAVEVMLAKGDLTDEDAKRLERIERAARDMSQHLTALLVLAREPNSEVVIEGEVDLPHIIEHVIETYKAAYSDNNKITLNLNLRDHVTVNAPSNIVSVLVGNLIRNAFLYTEKGSVNIQLEDNKLKISDTGIGISENDLPDIFKQGFRGSNAIGNGSGLGLSLSKRICDYYGWDLIIDSNINTGTTVTWYF